MTRQDSGIGLHEGFTDRKPATVLIQYWAFHGSIWITETCWTVHLADEFLYSECEDSNWKDYRHRRLCVRLSQRERPAQRVPRSQVLRQYGTTYSGNCIWCLTRLDLVEDHFRGFNSRLETYQPPIMLQILIAGVSLSMNAFMSQPSS